MIVFNTVLKIVSKYKFTIILYTVMLVFFGGMNFKTNNNSINYVATRPDVFIINHDEDIGITKDLIDYLDKNTNIKNLDNNDESISDALFYRDVSYIIYIPENFRNDFLNGKNPKINIKSTKEYNSILAENLLDNYIKIASIYRNNMLSEEDLIQRINKTINVSTQVEVTSKLDTDTLSQVTLYFNFLNYCILAGCVYVICLLLFSFKEKNIHKRMIISSTNYKDLNRKLLISMGIISFVLWIFYIALAFILLGFAVISKHGIIYIINSLMFMICALTLAFLIGNIINSKTAINGIINVVALGSSFLCGAFVPMEWLPDSVLALAHVLPSYWYIKTNELLKTMEILNFDTLKPIIINMTVILGFSFVFVFITNLVSNKKRKIN